MKEGLLLKYISVLLIVIVLLLSACSGDKETVKLDDKSFADTLFVQKVENNSSSGEMTKIVTDKDKIEKILSMVEGLKVEKTSNESLFEELKKQDVYMFGFFKGTATATKKGEYAFNILEDGTILFSNYDNQNSASVTTKEHIDLMEEIKQVLEINF